MIGFAIAVVLSQSRTLERGFIPYIVASQAVPLLAIAPVGLGSKGVRDWVPVAVPAAYLTFFPVTISAPRGLRSLSQLTAAGTDVTDKNHKPATVIVTAGGK